MFSDNDIACLFLLPYIPQLDQFVQVPGNMPVNKMWEILDKAITEDNLFWGKGYNDQEARDVFMHTMLHSFNLAVSLPH